MGPSIDKSNNLSRKDEEAKSLSDVIETSAEALLTINPQEFESEVLNEHNKVKEKAVATTGEPLTEIEERIISRSRAIEYIKTKDLQIKAGVDAYYFPKFDAKEFIENALDKQDITRIRVSYIKDKESALLFVQDDGTKQFTEKIIKDEILNCFSKAPSSKRAVHASYPTHGLLGNAIATGRGTGYSLWKPEKRPEFTTEISNATEVFKIGIKDLDNEVESYFVPEPFKQDLGFTTGILLKFPAETNLCDAITILEIVEQSHRLNPGILFEFRDDLGTATFPAIPEFARISKKDFGSAYWYTPQEFIDLANEKKHLTPLQFVEKFLSFRNRKQAAKVLKLAGLEAPKMSMLSREEVIKLYSVMKRRSHVHKAGVLPKLGELACKKMFSPNKISKYHLVQGEYCNSEKIIPFIVEMLAFEEPEEPNPKVYEAINFGISLHKPFQNFILGKSKLSLRDYMQRSGKSILIHLVCPDIDWLDPSKSNVSFVYLDESVHKAIKEVMKEKTIEKISVETLIVWDREVLNDNPDQYFTIRQIFYRLVSHKGYQNSRQCYKNVIKSLRIGRERGAIDPERIVDMTRPEYVNNPKWVTFTEYVELMLKELAEKVDVNRWSDQPVYIEVWIEKEALSRVILPICQNYRVNLIVCKGYSSETQLYKAIRERFPKDGRKIIILYLGDHDPAGLHIQTTLEEKLVRKAAIAGIRLVPGENFEVKRVALTFDQALKFNLPPSKLKNKPGPKAKEYKRYYEDNVWELDALEPEMLITLVKEAIEKNIEPSAWMKKQQLVQKCRYRMKERVKEVMGFLRKDIEELDRQLEED